MKNFCVLLNGSVANDARVLKTIRSLSTKYIVHLYYVSPKLNDNQLFNENVKLFPSSSPYGKLKKHLYNNLFFYKVYNFFIKTVLSSGIKYDYVWANDLPTLEPASIIAKTIDAKLIYDSHEIYTETINQFYSMDTFFVKKYIFKCLIFSMRFVGLRKEKQLIS